MSKYWAHENPFDVHIIPADGDGSRGAWINFPTTPETLRDIFQDLGIGPDDWKISEVADYVDGLSEAIESCTSLDELNYLAIKLEELGKEDVTQLRALTSANFFCDNVAMLINTCDNLDCFDYYFGISDDEELGRYWLFHETDFDRYTLNQVEDYIDFETYGNDINVEQGGVMGDGCYVVLHGGIEEYYDGRPESIPKEAIVTNLIPQPELDHEERLERSIEMAINLDNFFRAYDTGYAAAHPDEQQQKEAICDNLYIGKIALYTAMLKDLGQEADDVLPMELARYKTATRYDPDQDPGPEKLRLLVVEPGKQPREKLAFAGKEGLSEMVGGPIRVMYPFDDMVALVYNDEAKSMGLPLNRALYNEQGQPNEAIPGTFLLVGVGDDGIASLSEELTAQYANRFETVEVFAEVGGRTVMFKVPPENLDSISSKTLERIIRSGADIKKPSIRERLEAARKEISGRQAPLPTRSKSEPDR